MSAAERAGRRTLREELNDWRAAGWAIQSWIASCFDQVGICALCGSPNPQVHYNQCPWPRLRVLLDRDPGGPLTNGHGVPGDAGRRANLPPAG